MALWKGWWPNGWWPNGWGPNQAVGLGKRSSKNSSISISSSSSISNISSNISSRSITTTTTTTTDGGLGAGQAHEEWRSSQKHGPGLFRYVQAPHVRFRPHSAGAQGALPSNTQGTRSFAANIRDQLSSAENISAATARF